jgi:hypothetical protein
MAMFATSGRRLQAWWHWDAKMSYPGRDDEAAVLYELGELSLMEERELMPGWRQIYDHLCTLRGAAFREYLKQIVLPASLFCKWNAERRRARKRIRELEAAAIAAPPAA